jgi:Protein of unknown function (DUF2591)
MKTAELTGAALNWAVAQAEGMEGHYLANPYSYSTNWIFGGSIIERERISLVDVGIVNWKATTNKADMYVVTQYGDTPLIAAMRCYVASKLGDDVEIPAELLTKGE